jgi:NADPH:quinone reductase-like Zn-dependent oxidoreductase
MITIPAGVQTMKAIVCARPGKPGDVTLEDVSGPEVGEDGVLIRVHASSVNPVDLFPTTTVGYLMGGRKPQVLGTDYAGVVEAVGKTVTDFQPGDQVFGGGRGAFAEYKVAPVGGSLARLPAGVSFEHAGTVAVAATTALQALRDHGGVQRGQKVLINGASGGVGTFAVQIARALGAEVTAVCGTRNVEKVRSIGADHVIDYRHEDFTRGSVKYDLLIDVAGSHPWSECTRVLASKATFVSVGAAAVQHGKGGGFKAIGHFAGARLGSLIGGRGFAFFIAKLNRPDLQFLGELIASGQVTPVIERTCSLAEVPEALSYLNEGHTRAKVAIAVG